EPLAGQPRLQGPGPFLAFGQEGKVGQAGVAPRLAPLGLAVPGQEDVYRPSTSGRPVRRLRPAASITPPARKRLAGLTQTSPTATFRSTVFKAVLIDSMRRVAVSAEPDISGSGSRTP